MKQTLKAVLSVAAAVFLTTGCDVSGIGGDESSYGGSGNGSGTDTIRITPITDGFVVDWTKNYEANSIVFFRFISYGEGV